LHNDEREYVLSHDMFRWLARVGIDSDDQTNLKLARKNASLGRSL
jgi:hypothetical protein